MRNYSEIGCLTLLGVTLTVYVAAGNCQPGESVSDWSQKNINAESNNIAAKASGGKHYFVTVSARAYTENISAGSVSGIIARDITETNDFSLMSLPHNASFLSLQDITSSSISDFHVTSSVIPFDVLISNPFLSFSGEIRAGPLS